MVIVVVSGVLKSILRKFVLARCLGPCSLVKRARLYLVLYILSVQGASTCSL